jgi:hypothetical protein
MGSSADGAATAIELLGGSLQYEALRINGT